jgi:co-chaperonin GroES (HSP10)
VQETSPRKSASTNAVLVPDSVLKKENTLLSGLVANVGTMRKCKNLVIGQRIIFKKPAATASAVLQEGGVEYRVVRERDVLLAAAVSGTGTGREPAAGGAAAPAPAPAPLTADIIECVNGGVLVKPTVQEEEKSAQLLYVPSPPSGALKGEVVQCAEEDCSSSSSSSSRRRDSFKRGDHVFYRNDDDVVRIMLDGVEYHYISKTSHNILASVG